MENDWEQIDIRTETRCRLERLEQHVDFDTWDDAIVILLNVFDAFGKAWFSND